MPRYGDLDEVPPFLYVFGTVLYYAGVAMLIFCVSTGLMYISELAEEFTVLAKRIIRGLIVTISLAYVLIALVDGFPIWRCLIGLVGMGCYYSLTVGFPWVRLTSPQCILSCLIFALDHVLWYDFFLNRSRYPYWTIASFFMGFVWLTPIALFVSLAVADQALPTVYGGTLDAPAGSAKRRNFGAFFATLLPARVRNWGKQQ
jgi:hypothetical protein